MALVLIAKLQKGHAYLKAWPMVKELGAIFPEYRVISATKLGVKMMPPIAILTLFLPIMMQRIEFLPQAVFMALLFFLMPLQGFLWLGVRSEKPLPYSLVSWYLEIKQKLEEQGYFVAQAKPLTYQHLAVLLTQSYSCCVQDSPLFKKL